MKTSSPTNPLPYKTVENDNQELWLSEEEACYYVATGHSAFRQYFNT